MHRTAVEKSEGSHVLLLLFFLKLKAPPGHRTPVALSFLAPLLAGMVRIIAAIMSKICLFLDRCEPRESFVFAERAKR